MSISTPVSIRQGNLLLLSVASLPATAQERDSQSRSVLRGQLAGPLHELRGQGISFWYDRVSNAELLELQEDVELHHPRHATLTVPAGIWRSIGQSEWDGRGRTGA